MKFALAQMEVIPGSPRRNLATMLRMIGEAQEARADLIIFPELCLSGYILADLWADDSFVADLMTYNERLLEASTEIAIAYGNIYVDQDINTRWKDKAPHPNKDGRLRKYNAVYVMQGGRYAPRQEENTILPPGIQPKTLLPDYRIYDDERYFFSLQDVAKDAGVPLESLCQPYAIDTSNGPVFIGFEVCEDLWCNDYRRDHRSLNVTDMLIAHGAKTIVNISSSPWNEDKNASRDRRIQFLKKDSGERFVPFIYVNRTGCENNGKNIIAYDGGSTIYNAEGKPVRFASAPYKEELLSCAETAFTEHAVKRKEDDEIKQKFDAIVTGIKHIGLIAGEPLKFVIGLSGGIDSAAVAALLTMAVGRENVLAINMPSQFNSQRTRDNARNVAENLGIEYYVLPIDELSGANSTLLKSLDSKMASPEWMRELSDENIQAKIRGTSILSNIAGRYGYLMTNNGNKLEIALGYATLYGDINGAIAPIGDLTKTEVYTLARFINKEIFKRDVIPDILFPDALFRFDRDKILPSPELKKDQVNPMKFGYHCALLRVMTRFIRLTPEAVLKAYLDNRLDEALGISRELITRWGLDDPRAFVDDLDWFIRTVRKNIYKRVQAPPIVITSRSAYGYDYRESMLPFETTTRYSQLRDAVLASKTSS